MIRVTTNSTLHMYQSNLMQSSNQLYSAMEKLMTGRNFDSYASNPAGATRAFKLHSALNAVNAQAANNETVLNKFGTAYSILDEVTNELTHDLAQAPALGGLDNSHLSSLNSYAQVIRSLRNRRGSLRHSGGSEPESPRGCAYLPGLEGGCSEQR